MSPGDILTIARANVPEEIEVSFTGTRPAVVHHFESYAGIKTRLDIGTSLTELVESEEELLFVIFHELDHVRVFKKHSVYEMQRLYTEYHQEHEVNADRAGIEKAGVGPALRVLDRLRDYAVREEYPQDCLDEVDFRIAEAKKYLDNGD